MERTARGFTDPNSIMQTVIQPNFDTIILPTFNELEEDVKDDVKKIFDLCCPSIENCGDHVFTSTKFQQLNIKFADINDPEETRRFIELFYELGILEW